MMTFREHASDIKQVLVMPVVESNAIRLMEHSIKQANSVYDVTLEC